MLRLLTSFSKHPINMMKSVSTHVPHPLTTERTTLVARYIVTSPAYNRRVDCRRSKFMRPAKFVFVHACIVHATLLG